MSICVSMTENECFVNQITGFIHRLTTLPKNTSLQTSQTNTIIISTVSVLKLVSAIYFSPNDSPSETMKNVFYFI